MKLPGLLVVLFMRAMKSVVMMILLIGAASCEATIYYLDNIKGNDDSVGTRQKPWRTVRYATANLKAGDELILIANGPQYPYRERILLRLAGTTEYTIKIGGEPGKQRPYLVGSEDLSDGRAGGKQAWSVSPKNLWKLVNIPKLTALWVTEASEWKQGGVTELQERKSAPDGNKLEPGEWYHDKLTKTLLYMPKSDESIDNIHIEGVVTGTVISVRNSSYLDLHNLMIMLSANTAVEVREQSSYIKLFNLGVRHAYNNGIIVMEGGGNIIIENCEINDIANCGVKIMGDPYYHVHDTVVRGCRIANVHGNDAITIHKDQGYHDVGENHLIENNVLHDNKEDGIDITSGRKIKVRNNTTYNNGETGIVVSHWAEDVSIENHLSINDGKKKGGINIMYSRDVSLINSLIYNSLRYSLFLNSNDGFVARNNTFIAGTQTTGSVIRISGSSRNNRFERNIIVSLNNLRRKKLLYVQVGNVRDVINGKEAGHPSVQSGSLQEALGGSFYNNVWWTPYGKLNAFYNKSISDLGHGFKEFESNPKNANNIFVNPELHKAGQWHWLPEQHMGFSGYGYNGQAGAEISQIPEQ